MSQTQSGPTTIFGNDPTLPIVLALQALTTSLNAVLLVLQNSALKAPAYALAGLPTGAVVGTLAFATNVRTGSEGAGAGTGALMQYTTAGWQVVGTGLAGTV